MSQCVPSWDLDENSIQPSNSSIKMMDDYQVAELTWENGQLAMHGLGHPQCVSNNNKPINATWDKLPRVGGGGTLESIVNQATNHHQKSTMVVPWFDHHRKTVNTQPTVSASMTVTTDALVPCNNTNAIKSKQNGNQENLAHVMDSSLLIGGTSTRVGSCSGIRVACSVKGKSLSAGSTCGDTASRELTLDTCGGDGGFTSPTLGSPGDTSSGKEYTKISGDDYDSICQSKIQKKAGGDDGKKKGLGISSKALTKRTRAAAIHNQSERKRRDKINQKMKTLQKLVPNSSKTDKASMLDEVIDYLKQLQAQLHMITRMSMPSMMLPAQLAMQQQLQMSMMGMGMGINMGGMDMNTLAAAGMPPHVMPSPAAFMQLPSSNMPIDPYSTFLTCQAQPMTMDVYSRLAAVQQQHFQQNHGSGQKN